VTVIVFAAKTKDEEMNSIARIISDKRNHRPFVDLRLNILSSFIDGKAKSQCKQVKFHALKGGASR
jgi:hypothetical protein